MKQTREDTYSQVNQYIMVWPWEGVRQGLAETVPETDNNSLQVERKVTL